MTTSVSIGSRKREPLGTRPRLCVCVPAATLCSHGGGGQPGHWPPGTPSTNDLRPGPPTRARGSSQPGPRSRTPQAVSGAGGGGQRVLTALVG